MRRHIADALLRACSGVGVLIGALLGHRHQPQLHCAAHGGSSTALDRCTSHVMSGVVLHWGIALGGGFLVGATAGLLAVLVIRPRAQRAVG